MAVITGRDEFCLHFAKVFSIPGEVIDFTIHCEANSILRVDCSFYVHKDDPKIKRLGGSMKEIVEGPARTSERLTRRIDTRVQGSSESFPTGTEETEMLNELARRLVNTASVSHQDDEIPF